MQKTCYHVLQRQLFKLTVLPVFVDYNEIHFIVNTFILKRFLFSELLERNSHQLQLHDIGKLRTHRAYSSERIFMC